MVDSSCVVLFSIGILINPLPPPGDGYQGGSRENWVIRVELSLKEG